MKARIDGLNEFTIWWKVAMPLVTPALSALAIFTFLGNWTAFFWPLIVFLGNQDIFTLPLGILKFKSEFNTQWPELMAASEAIHLGERFGFAPGFVLSMSDELGRADLRTVLRGRKLLDYASLIPLGLRASLVVLVSIRIPTSISMPSTRTHVPSTRTSVAKFVVA